MDKQATLLENNAFLDLTNKTIEDLVLGTFINYPDVYYNYAEEISEKEFDSKVNKIIFLAIQELGQTSKIDIGTLLTKLRENSNHLTINKLSGIGYDELVTSLCEQIQTSEHAKEHVDILKMYAQRRALDKLAKEIYSANSEHKDIKEIISKAGSSLVELQQTSEKDEFIITNEIATIFKELRGDIKINYEKSYFEPLDKFMYGWEETDFIIFAGAASMGKTSFALEVAKNKSFRNEGVLMFSLEMGKKQLLKRILASDSGVDQYKLRNRILLTDDDWDAMNKSINRIERANLIIDDSSSRLHNIISKIKKHVIKNKIKIVIIDYLQLISFDGKGASNREQEISKISRSLKELARELKIPIIALSQINRSVSGRASKRPMLSDLRESGSLEQDADMVVFCYREVYYNIEMANTNSIEEAELIVAKGRSTGTGIIKCGFNPKLSKYVPYEFNV